jgi:putative sigma-54 modulation protein
MMEITVRGKNLEVTPALVSYTQKKLGKLAKFFDKATEAQAMLTVIRDEHIVEVTVIYEGLILRGEESSGDMYASIDLVVEKLEKQVSKYKTRLNRSLRQRGLRPVSVKLVEGQRDTDDEAQLVKTKRFTLKPMDLEEAILQMNLLGHDFFVFANAETETMNVLYRRKDGNYGLIEPENFGTY